ncbi:hypothetical protein [Actinoplanes sp. NPDC051859]|uniref:YqeB family protein n=1 Tax=Actinoplanes sp. NPDC051859 TaxID=3363909 RepID=UPI0037B94F77
MIEERTVATPASLRVAVWLGVPAAGAGLGWLIHYLLDWILRIPFAPFRSLLRQVERLGEPQATIGALVVGAGLGLIFAFYIDREALTVRVAGTEVVLTRPGVHRTVPRADITTAYRDRDHLVLLDRTGREVAREPFLVGARRLAALFGTAWHDQDPYAEEYRRWVPGLPQVPAEAEALFAARQRALDKHDDRDVRELRTELARLGYVLRDDRKRQHFRRADQ